LIIGKEKITTFFQIYNYTAFCAATRSFSKFLVLMYLDSAEVAELIISSILATKTYKYPVKN